jgi:hypothetical protein
MVAYMLFLHGIYFAVNGEAITFVSEYLDNITP